MIANLRSGNAKRAFTLADRALADAAIQVSSVQFSLSRDSIAEAVDGAKKHGIDLLIALGGDGTIGSVVNGIAGRGVTLGVIPAGTSNNFARSLRIPLTVRESVEVIASGIRTSIDVGRANDLYFAHAAIMGLHPDFARDAERLRRTVGRLSYPIAAVRTYMGRRQLDVRIVGPSRTYEIAAYQVAVLSGGHGTDPATRDRPQHCLQLLTVRDLNLATVAAGLPRIVFRRHLGLPGATAIDLPEARIETDRPTPVTLDGEIRTQTPVDIRLVPNGLSVMTGNGHRPSRLGKGGRS